MVQFLKKNKYILYILSIIGAISLTQCSGSIDSQLKSLAKESNSKCPRILDQWTRLDSCAAFTSKQYKYYHTISEIIVSDTTLLKSQLTPQIIALIKTNPDMKFFRDNDITLSYQYNDQNKNYLFSITITPEDYKK